MAATLALAFSTSAWATSSPIAIGVNSSGLPTVPAVAVDSAGTAYVVWNQPSATVLDFCKLAVGATGCSPVSIQVPNPANDVFFDPPSVLVSGSDVYVFEEMFGAGHDNDGIDEWFSTDGGATFTRVPHAVGQTGVGDSMGTNPQPVVPLFGGNFGMSAISAISNPTFQANSLLAPQDYSVATEPNPYATLNPSPAAKWVSNLGGEMVSQLTGSSGLLGVYSILDQGPCPSSFGLVYAYAPLSPATTNAQLNTTTGGFGSPWQPLGTVSCNAGTPGLTSGPSGLGLLSTQASTPKVLYQRFTPPSTWGAPVTVTGGGALEPSLSQDGTGGIYAAWLVNGIGLRLAYSGNGGSSWSGPITLFGLKNGSGPDSMNSAVGPGGQGWAVYAIAGTEYAQPFSKNDALPPAITHLKLKPKKFAPQSKGGSIVKKLKKHEGTTVSYTDSKPAKTTFNAYLLVPGYKHKKGSCKALKTGQKRPKHTHSCQATQFKGSFTHQDVAGSNSFKFTGRVTYHKHLKTLGAGSYELQATPTLSPFTGSSVTAKFKIK